MPSLLQALSIAVFSIGAPVFLVLSYFYWRNRQRGTRLFRVFTAICGASFLANLAALVGLADLEMPRAVLVSLLPPLMVHLALERGGAVVPRALMAVLYVCAVLLWEHSAPFVLAACATLAIASSWRAQMGGPERAWMLSVFAAMLLNASAILMSDNPLFEIAPDYLLLLFFSVHLYYSERLAFFDLFLRTVVFLALGLTALTPALFAIAFRGDWTRSLLTALALTPLWLSAPFLYRRLGRWIDRLALGRRYAPQEAEKAFVLSVQSAASVEELRTAAVRKIEEIFDCRAEIDFEGAGGGELAAVIPPHGVVRLSGREAPFLSDDSRLLDSLASMLGVVLQNVRLRQQREELLAMAGRAELRALRAQINPHFLFNALNAVSSSIATRPEAAEETLTQLAEVFRYTLRRSHTEWVPLVDELDFIRAYLAVERARFGNRLQVEIRGDQAAPGVTIPSMIVQPLVENAIKHGTSQVVGTGRLTLEIAPLGDLLRITVQDNGPGFAADSALNGGPGHGLRNVMERLRGYYGDRAALRCENSPMGTRVRIELPVGVRRQCVS